MKSNPFSSSKYVFENVFGVKKPRHFSLIVSQLLGTAPVLACRHLWLATLEMDPHSDGALLFSNATKCFTTFLQGKWLKDF